MRYFLSLLGCLLVLSAAAQQMRVEDFTRYKHPFWQKATYETDKRQALLDLFTNEKGFQFFVGKTAVTAIEGEGLVTISLPHPSIRAPRITRAGRFLKFYFPDTRRRSRNGSCSNPWSEPGACVPTCWASENTHVKKQKRASP